MRFMLIVKANRDSEAGILPSPELLAEMGKFNEEMVNAGVLVAGEGLHPSAKGARVHFADGTRTVTKGPFAATQELVAGFWIIEAKSLEEAIEWARRAPNPMPGQRAEIEVRQVYSADDFAPVDPTGELREAEAKLRARSAAQR